MIRADDGARYSFRQADWRNPTAPVAGANVDFNTEGGEARDVFLIGRTAAAAGGTGAGLSGVSLRPALFIAAVILAGGFFPLISIPEAQLAAASAQFRASTGATFDLNPTLYGYFELITFVVSHPERANAGASMAFIFYGIYAIPALALWTVFAELARGGASKTLRMATGLTALFGLFVVPLLAVYAQMSAAGQAERFGDAFKANGILSQALGPGVIVIMAGGVFMLLSAFGVLPNAGANVSAPSGGGHGGGATAPAAPAPAFTPGTAYTPPRPAAAPPPPAYAPPAYSPPPAYAPPPPAYAPPAPPAYAPPPPAYATAPSAPPRAASAGGGFVLRPALILSAVLLGGCFLPLFDVVYGPGASSLVGIFEPMSAQIAAANAVAGDTIGPPSLFYLIYLIPALAAWMLIAELLNVGGKGASALLRSGVATVSFLAPAGLLGVLPHFVDLNPAPPPFGLGAFVIMGAGCLVLLNVVGLIPTPRGGAR